MSVVVPVLNGAEHLAAQLEALSRQTYERGWEVVIADNGSTDGTRELVEGWDGRLPRLRLVDASGRRGSNHARNAGAAAAEGDFLAFCDADDVVTPGWLEALVRAGQSWDLVGGWCDDSALNERSYWRVPAPRDRLPVVLGFLPYGVGANLGVWAHVNRAIGGWNEAYVQGGTEVEFCWRAQLASYKLGFAPDAVVQYRHRRDLRALARQHVIYGIAEPRLYRDFRAAGVPRKRLRGALRSWAWVAVHLPDLLRSAERRGTWVRRAAFNWGRVRGSIRYRVVCL